MDSGCMFELAERLAIAKSRQDVAAALEVLHPDMVLETPAFGTRVQGLAENERIWRSSSSPSRTITSRSMATPVPRICWSAGARCG